MKWKTISYFLIVLTNFILFDNEIVCAQSSGMPHTTSLDFDWRFHRGGAMGAEQPSFADSQWRVVDLPHDWSIEDLPGTSSPFGKPSLRLHQFSV